MNRLASPDAVAAAAWVFAATSAACVACGVARHALALSIAFRALTAWRLCAGARVLQQRNVARASTAQLAALGSAVAHGALVASAMVVLTVRGDTLVALQRTCAAAARCGPDAAAVLVLGIAGLAHAIWMLRVTRACVLAARSPTMAA